MQSAKAVFPRIMLQSKISSPSNLEVVASEIKVSYSN